MREGIIGRSSEVKCDSENRQWNWQVNVLLISCMHGWLLGIFDIAAVRSVMNCLFRHFDFVLFLDVCDGGHCAHVGD